MCSLWLSINNKFTSDFSTVDKMSDTDNQSTSNDVPPDDNQKLKDLEATIMKLQAENDSRRTSCKEPDGAQQFIKNLTQGINPLDVE